MMSSNNKSVPDSSSAGSRRTVLKAVLTGASALAIQNIANSMPSDQTANVSSPEPASNETYDVVIIGAGLAGLTAARDLMQAGNQSFVVLEAQNRVGGRVLNHQLDNGYVSEAGGQWIGPGQTAIANLARELGIGTFKSEYAGKSVFEAGGGRIAIDTQGSPGIDPLLVNALESLAETVPEHAPWTAPNADALDAMSLADWLDKQDLSALDRANWSLASLLSTGTAPATVSFLHVLSMLSTAGGRGGLQVLFGQKDGAQETRFVGGSQAIANTIAEQLRDRLRYESPVLSIQNWDSAFTDVITPSHTFSARRVIVALSPPLCSQIQFSPALPAQRQALQKRWPAHAPMCKTAMVYDTPFWRDEGYNGHIFQANGPILWAYDNSPPGGEIGVINAFVRVAEVPSSHSEAGHYLASLYAHALRDKRLLNPIEYHQHDWGEDEYSLTCVSPMPTGLLTSGLMPALRENCGNILWAGTETAEIWPGYMDGAVRSGHHAALRVIQGLAESNAEVARVS